MREHRLVTLASQASFSLFSLSPFSWTLQILSGATAFPSMLLQSQSQSVAYSTQPMKTTIRLSRIANFSISKLPDSIDATLTLRPRFLKKVCSFGWKVRSQTSFIHADSFGRIEWSIRNSVDGSGFDSSSGNGGRPRLIRVIQGFQTKLGVRIQELRKNLPMKILFFLVGFYCATAFATVIGQTGDWDILSAALAVFIVEGIGALMYRASVPLVNNVRSLITMFNYWKAGLSLGLFLDSFKYELDKITDFSHPLSFGLDDFALFM